MRPGLSSANGIREIYSRKNATTGAAWLDSAANTKTIKKNTALKCTQKFLLKFSIRRSPKTIRPATYSRIFLKLCDCNGVVDMTAEAIARRTNVPLEIIKEEIAILEAPDPASRNPAHDGRIIALFIRKIEIGAGAFSITRNIENWSRKNNGEKRPGCECKKSGTAPKPLPLHPHLEKAFKLCRFPLHLHLPLHGVTLRTQRHTRAQVRTRRHTLRSQ